MKVIVIDENNNYRINRFIDWLVYMVGYAIVLLAVSTIFTKSFYIDGNYFGIWGLIAAIIIYILNKTVKPVLVWLTLPLTGLTLGLFYPFINVIILNMVDAILGSHFNIQGLIMSFFIAILISIMNGIMDVLIIDPIVKRGR